MADKWAVYITYAVEVESQNALDPFTSEDDWEKLRTHAVLKMWTDGYETVKTNADITFDNLSMED